MVKPWSRVATSLTGRPSRFAAMAIQAVLDVGPPFEPKAPPTKRETVRTRDGSIPSCLATADFSPHMLWEGSKMVRRGPSQTQVVVKSSIGL
jgi:hypothetical protein